MRPTSLLLVAGLAALASWSGGPGAPASAAEPTAGGIPVAGYERVAEYRFGTGPGANVRSKADLARLGQFRFHWDNDRGDTLPGNGEWQRYRDYPDGDPRSNHVFTPDSLRLTARLAGGLEKGGIESGMWLTHATFKYGYFEIEMKVPGGAGMWPAFWMMSDKAPGQDYRWPPEVDILDQFNENRFPGDNTPPHRFAQGCVTAGNDAAHELAVLYSDPAFDPQWGLYNLPAGTFLSTDFHRWGVEWTPDDVWTFYFDGKMTKRLHCRWIFSAQDKAEANPAFLIVNLAVGGNWFTPNDPAAFPDALEVRRITVYQKAGRHEVHGPLPGNR